MTLRTVELLGEYEPGAYVDRISPTPLLMIIADGDHLAVADEAFAAYNRALEPKRLLVLKGGHFDAYVRDFAAASGAACDWFVRQLMSLKRLRAGRVTRRFNRFVIDRRAGRGQSHRR